MVTPNSQMKRSEAFQKGVAVTKYAWCSKGMCGETSSWLLMVIFKASSSTLSKMEPQPVPGDWCGPSSHHPLVMSIPEQLRSWEKLVSSPANLQINHRPFSPEARKPECGNDWSFQGYLKLPRDKKTFSGPQCLISVPRRPGTHIKMMSELRGKHAQSSKSGNQWHGAEFLLLLVLLLCWVRIHWSIYKTEFLNF
jgi:hypothetical protein